MPRIIAAAALILLASCGGTYYREHPCASTCPWHNNPPPCADRMRVFFYILSQSDKIDEAEQAVGRLPASECVCAEFTVTSVGAISSVKIVSSTSEASANQVREILKAASPLEKPPDSAQCLSDSPYPMSFGERAR